MRFVARLAVAVGHSAAQWLLYPICAYFFVSAPSERKASREFLRRAQGREPSSVDVFRHLHTFALVLLDRVYLLAGHYRRFDVKVHGAELVHQIAREGRGCLLFGAHMGSFEIPRFLAQEAHGLTVRLAMFEENARKMSAVYNAMSVEGAMPVVALGRPDSMLRIEEALDRGEMVGILADRTFSEKGTLRRSFLGGEAAFPLGPFRLAALLGRPVVLMFCVRGDDGRYEVHFEPLPAGRAEPGERRSAALERSVQAFASRLEHHCRRAPYNWFNFYDYWH
jgi:predicted LPLAT superfamily acyltransferase